MTKPQNPDGHEKDVDEPGRHEEQYETSGPLEAAAELYGAKQNRKIVDFLRFSQKSKKTKNNGSIFHGFLRFSQDRARNVDFLRSQEICQRTSRARGAARNLRPVGSCGRNGNKSKKKQKNGRFYTMFYDFQTQEQEQQRKNGRFSTMFYDFRIHKSKKHTEKIVDFLRFSTIFTDTRARKPEKWSDSTIFYDFLRHMKDVHKLGGHEERHVSGPVEAAAEKW